MTFLLNRESHASRGRTTEILMVLIVISLALAGIFLFSSQAQAESKRGFEALQVIAPKQGFTISPGDTQEVMIGFQNVGEVAWTNSGSSYVSIYTYDPKYRASDFKADDWEDYTQAALLDEDSVAVGEIGHIYLTLDAPKSEGQYSETFHLAAEDTAWIPGGEFTLVINVEGEVQEEAEDDTVADGEASPETDGLSATVLLRSARNLEAEAGEEIEYTVGIKNTGSTTWTTREVLTSDVAIASSDTEHDSWLSSTQLVLNDTGSVKPGGLDFLKFTFTAPSTKGSHTVRYLLAANDTIIPDFYIDIPVDVTTGSEAIIDEEITIEESDIQADRMIDEPVLRIGLLTIDEETDWVTEISCNTSWKLRDSEDGLLGTMEADDMVRAFYKNQRYYFNRGRGIEETHKYLRFVPDDEDAICTIENFDRRETRNAAYADNTFRDTLELQYIPYKDETWVINELPIEEYLYGLAETSDYSHEEFKKALITVARTYGVYHFERYTKHYGYFHMNAYADDQVYKGYEYENRHPSIREAVEDTRGVTVNYDNATALTPYFSRSDGRTRDWSEVWGGEVAWCQGVETPHDAAAGRTLWGHGVGMSATEALDMAEDGDSWEEILEYFYTGIELNQRWE